MSASYVANLFPKPTPSQTDERLAVSSTAVPFGTNWKTINTNRFVVLDVQTNDIMCTVDGGDQLQLTAIACMQAKTILGPLICAINYWASADAVIQRQE
jgi:hypothetical protein